MSSPEISMKLLSFWNLSEINEHDKIENDPLLKLSTKLQEIDKGFLFRK